MMKNKYKIAAGMLCAAFLLNTAVPVHAGEEEKPHKISVTYETKDKHEERSFETGIKKAGKKFRLKSVNYQTIEERPDEKTEEVTMLQDSEPVVKGASYQGFPEKVEKEGITYELAGITEKDAETYVQKVEGCVEYEYPVTEADVPRTKNISVKNEKTGEQENAECRLSGIRKTGTRWVDSEIQMTVKGYDSHSILWQGKEFPNDMGEIPFRGYETELLASVGLDGNTGKIRNTYWTKDAYRNAEGVLCRDAKADIRKVVPVYRAQYQGELQTPMSVFQAEYAGNKITKNSSDMIYTIRAEAVYEREKMNPAIFLAAGIGILASALAMCFMILAKKKKERKGRNYDTA